MKLSTLLALPASLLTLLSPVLASNTYTENLHLRPLPTGSLYAGFTFTATTPLSAYSASHFRYFPRSLAQILQYTHTAELHLRFALGRWDEEAWGSRPRGGLREGGNGVEIWAWVEDGSEGALTNEEDEGRTAEERWSDLVNSLSGLFCASLNFIDSGKTTKPVLSFEPEGSLEEMRVARGNLTGERGGELKLLHGMLPHEVVCTENLTPFLKLLPCKGKAGIASLLDGHKVFDANFQTMAVDVRPVCHEGGECDLEIQQTVDMVLDLERSMRPRESPIPRPPPIEDVACDESKEYHAHDTCYPKPMEGEMEWSLSRVFGRPIRGSCPLASPGNEIFDITLEVPAERMVEIVAEAPIHQWMEGPTAEIREYKLPEGKDFDLHLPMQSLSPESSARQSPHASDPPIRASRQITGYGAERGGMHTLLHNPQPIAQKIVYLESLPWFLRPYIHTLSLTSNTSSPGNEQPLLEKIYYTPLLDRERGTHLELLLTLPPASTTSLTYSFEKAILRYTEYPPDANRGFDIPAAIIRVLDPSDIDAIGAQQGTYLRTTSLLLPLPTPDFSMPYNVIILTSTVVALGFGSVFNLLVRRFVLVGEVPVGGLAIVVGRVRERVLGLREKVRGLIKGKGGVDVGAKVNGVIRENGRGKREGG